MHSFPDNLSFRYPWRSYQEKVLNQLGHHLSNRHLHLVAPPGSGKTVLGLEVMLRLNEPTFIVAPTLAIKNQWADRFVELFLQTSKQPDWISTDIRKPAFVTITTYQSLHSLYQRASSKDTIHSNEEAEQEEAIADLESSEEAAANAREAEAIMDAIRSVGVKTLILDEAHHLRTGWWRSTITFRDSLHAPAVIALTATPPYDVSAAEWQRYIDLCGPIDLEISVPELVREAELCPHQDFIYASMPSKEEIAFVGAFQQEVRAVQKEILVNSAIIQLLEKHPWIADCEKHIEDILSSPSYFSSMLIFLREAGSMAWEQGLPLLGESDEKLPRLDEEWLEELLNGFLFRDRHIDPKDTAVKQLRRRLHRTGAIERRKVYLRSNPSIDRMLIQSVSKLDSINSIVDFEVGQLGDGLRLVILADYIRLPDLPKASGDEKPLTRLGVIPIFESIRRRLGRRVSLGVLTGSIVIVPQDSLPLLEKSAEELEMSFSCRPLPHDADYVIVEVTGAGRQQLVSAVTAVFSNGGIQVLVGTAALLGEGWDAPSVNTLIMASYVGTFMLSNQMRGRAIRTDRMKPEKTSNIWHLVCVDRKEKLGGSDMQTVTRRFQSLVGLAFDRDSVETGIGRMNLPPPPFSEVSIEKMNDWMLTYAGRREELSVRWNRAIVNKLEMVEELKTAKELLPRPFKSPHTLKALVVFGMVSGLIYLFDIFDFLIYYPKMSLLMKLLIAGGIALLVSWPFLFKAIRLYLRHGTLESSMVELGQALYGTLHHIGLIETAPSPDRVGAEQDIDGHVMCWMNGGTTHEQTVFVKALQELLDPVDNPRYLLIRKEDSKYLKRKDYHAVPQEIGRRKEHAEYFLAQWEKHIGKGEIVYTRTKEGRKLLLKARMQAMSAAFVKKGERISVWR